MSGSLYDQMLARGPEDCDVGPNPRPLSPPGQPCLRCRRHLGPAEQHRLGIFVLCEQDAEVFVSDMAFGRRCSQCFRQKDGACLGCQWDEERYAEVKGG